MKVHGKWTPSIQLLIFQVTLSSRHLPFYFHFTKISPFQLAREVTFTIWNSLLAFRQLKYGTEVVINPPVGDMNELLRFEESFACFLSSGGHKALRLYASAIRIVVRLLGLVSTV